MMIETVGLKPAEVETKPKEKMSTRTINDRLCGAILVLNMTGLSSFLAVPFDMHVAHVTLATFLVNIWYLFVKEKAALYVFRKAKMVLWFVFLVGWPVLTILYSPEFTAREIGLRLYYFTLLLVSATFVFLNGFDAFARLSIISFIISGFGLILSIFAERYFLKIALITNSLSDYHGRAFGFFLQPNAAASGVTFIFIALAPKLHSWKPGTRLVAIFCYATCVLITGSRGGLLLSLSVIALYLLHQVQAGSLGNFKVALLFIGALIIVGSLQVVHPVIEEFVSSRIRQINERNVLLERFEIFLKFRLATTDIGSDRSVSARIEVQEQFLEAISERPVLGYGFGANSYLKRTNFFRRSSHNQYLLFSMECGIFYALLFILLVCAMHRHPNRRRIEQALCLQVFTIFVVAVLLKGMVSSSLVHDRAFYVVLGGLLALLRFPERVLDIMTIPPVKKKTREKNIEQALAFD